MNHAVIVGGGISGIISALLLGKSGYQVSIIERNHQIGGLLNSFYTNEGEAFDYGTHILAEIGIRELDDLLLDEVINNPLQWNRISPILTGNYFNGKMDNEGPCINASFLPKETYEKALVEFLSVVPIDGIALNLNEQLLNQYGDTFTECIFKPIIHKFTLTDLKELAPDAFELFLPKRIKVLTPYITRQLKSDEFFDNRIANHSFSDSRNHFYPKKDGIGLWIHGLQEKLTQHNVTIYTNESISKIKYSDQRIRNVTLGNSNKQLPVDQLVWAAPPSALLSLAEITSGSYKVNFRKVKLFHFTFDKPFLSDLYYINCYDDQLQTFRITLYPNFNGKKSIAKCTVEVLLDQEQDIAADDVVAELRTMGIIDSSSRILFAHSDIIGNGFPIVTSRFEENLHKEVELLEDHFSNVTLLGRAKSKKFLMRDIIIDTYESIQAII